MDMETTDFLRVLEALGKKVNRNLNVAEIVKIDDITEVEQTATHYYKYQCTVVSTNAKIVCLALDGLTLAENDYCLVVFCNRDIRENFSKIYNSSPTQQTTDTDYHSVSYGIIIGKIK